MRPLRLDPAARALANAALAALFLALLPACETQLGPDRFELDSEPRGASAYVDGSLRGSSPASVPVRYYGEHLLELERAPYLPGRQYFAPSRELHELAPPATPWIFPADFLVEAARRLAGWRPDDVLRRLPSVDLRPTRPLADSGEALDVEAAIQAADEAAQVRQ
jgi:hypothetical protein